MTGMGEEEQFANDVRSLCDEINYLLDGHKMGVVVLALTSLLGVSVGGGAETAEDLDKRLAVTVKHLTDTSKDAFKFTRKDNSRDEPRIN
jgi:hypothetical protein